MKIIACLLAWTTHGPCLYFGLLGRCGARIGWGWDADLPLRPWPATHFGHSPAGRRDLCVAWCGFYVGATWGRPSTPAPEPV